MPLSFVSWDVSIKRDVSWSALWLPWKTLHIEKAKMRDVFTHCMRWSPGFFKRLKNRAMCIVCYHLLEKWEWISSLHMKHRSATTFMHASSFVFSLKTNCLLLPVCYLDQTGPQDHQFCLFHRTVSFSQHFFSLIPFFTHLLEMLLLLYSTFPLIVGCISGFDSVIEFFVTFHGDKTYGNKCESL